MFSLVSWIINACRMHKKYKFSLCFFFVFASLLYGAVMRQKWKLITTDKVERNLYIGSIVFELLAVMLCRSGPPQVFSPCTDMLRFYWKLMATISCKICVQILLRKVLTCYVVKISAVTDPHCGSEPTLSCSQFPSFFRSWRTEEFASLPPLLEKLIP
jgi:hypothetical protein